MTAASTDRLVMTPPAPMGGSSQNLQSERQDCWELGPPPRPSNAELIRRAGETDEGKVFLGKYPDSITSIRLNNTPSNQPEVTFTPIAEDRIKFIVTFTGLDWNVSQIGIICTDGNQTWYRYASEHDFWTYFQPERGDCWDYPPPET
jgi:hypothetical protein